MLAFVPDDFEVPLELATDRFRMEPLGPEHNERDHEAWMSSIAHIRATPGFPDGKWPTAMSAEQNLADLVRHARDFAFRTGFTYSVLDGDEVIGCVYLYPTHDGEHDVEAQSWVRASRAELDVALMADGVVVVGRDVAVPTPVVRAAPLSGAQTQQPSGRRRPRTYRVLGRPDPRPFVRTPPGRNPALRLRPTVPTRARSAPIAASPNCLHDQGHA